uniref:ATP synthase F0 subunit 8 n=1 Tax=Bannacoris arboreus TaxID=1837149 RepID=A0A2P1CLQ1_9HEMI|nr:ATP synthase F0 subunit 8 [Bannacoris arboreus]AVJ52264.1 ATP synthase F0 subunit 8 [Bannacoris arboreus]WEM32395.1 ATP synthase F0 subunit 8 [Bannacoris arboreus]
MPQMSPIMWESMFLTFMMLLLTTTMIIFHMNNIKPITKENMTQLKILNWKW